MGSLENKRYSFVPSTTLPPFGWLGAAFREYIFFRPVTYVIVAPVVSRSELSINAGVPMALPAVTGQQGGGMATATTVVRAKEKNREKKRNTATCVVVHVFSYLKRVLVVVEVTGLALLVGAPFHRCAYICLRTRAHQVIEPLCLSAPRRVVSVFAFLSFSIFSASSPGAAFCATELAIQGSLYLTNRDLLVHDLDTSEVERIGRSADHH